MSVLADATTFGRFALGLRGFLRRRITLDEARATVRRRLASREDNFLRLAERGIFGRPKSPYRELFALARCDLGDVRVMLRDRGLDDTLRALREAGVYVTFEEFKGRAPIVRDGREVRATPRDFDNPFLSHHYTSETGGSTGAGTRIPHDLNHLAAVTPLHLLTYHAHGVLGAPVGLWAPVLPNSSGINNILRSALMGNVVRAWFSPVVREDLRPALKYRIATSYVIGMSRLFGVHAPAPLPVRFTEAGVVARWAADTVRVHGACIVRTSVSMALRVAIAAGEQGIDLTGVTLVGGGEPPTPAKVRGITRTGARWLPTYAFSETGPVGAGCANPLDGNDLHPFEDTLGLIQHPQTVPGTPLTVDAFCFTTLLPTAPKLLLNVESDDFGVIETRRCGCALEEAGYTRHVRHVRSFRKLTGEGVTLIGSDMERILEEVLPARFGGSALDYQLLEEEDADGFTRISVVVSPRVALDDEREVTEVVRAALRRTDAAADIAGAIWQQAGTLRVRRAEPTWTARGKLMTLHTAARA